MMGFFTAPKIAFGPGAIEQLAGMGIRRALLVVDPELARRSGSARVREELAKIDASVESFEGVEIPPNLAAVKAGAERAAHLRPDTIVALGAGSTIATAKGIWVAYARPDVPLGQVTPLQELDLRRTCRFVAIPSTGGSGTEAGWTVRLHAEGSSAIDLSSRELVADWALLDPAFSRTLPPRPTAEAGANALALALESLATEWGHPVSDALARAAVALILPALPRAVKHPDDLEPRAALLYAAAMAGIAAANSQVGVGEALAQAIGDEVRLPHGRLVAALLPYVVEFNYPVAREKYATLAPAVGSAAIQHRTSLAERLWGLWESVGLPRTLALAGANAEELRAKVTGIVQRASRTPSALGNPRIASPQELAQLLVAAIDGSPVTF